MTKNTKSLTPALVIFKDKDILLKRPENMPYEDYKVLRGVQNRVIKKLFTKSPNPKIVQAMGIKQGYNSHLNKL